MNNSVLSISVAFATVGYVIYLAITSSVKIKTFLSPDTNKNANHILFQRLFGLLIFGILPLLCVLFISVKNPGDYGINFSLNKKTLLWTLILAVLIVTINYFNSRKPDNLAQYPQIRNTHWSAGLLFASAISWIVYLFSYEMLFRGFLLFSALKIMGYWPAIILNTGIYSLAHYSKGLKEAFGAIPFGIIICILTIYTGNFLIAFFAHTILSLSNEWLSLYIYSRKIIN